MSIVKQVKSFPIGVLYKMLFSIGKSLHLFTPGHRVTRCHTWSYKRFRPDIPGTTQDNQLKTKDLAMPIDIDEFAADKPFPIPGRRPLSAPDLSDSIVPLRRPNELDLNWLSDFEIWAGDASTAIKKVVVDNGYHAVVVDRVHLAGSRGTISTECAVTISFKDPGAHTHIAIIKFPVRTVALLRLDELVENAILGASGA